MGNEQPRNYLMPAMLIALIGLVSYQIYETAQLKKQLAELQERQARPVINPLRPGAARKPPPALAPPDPMMDPLESIREMQREMDELLNNRMGALKSGSHAGALDIELSATADAFEARVTFDDIANVEVKVHVDSANILRISGTQKQAQTSQPGSGASHSSSVTSNFERAITLPQPVRSEDLRTSKEGNTLVVIIPKA